MLKVYQYPRCSTCRKALKWLTERNIAYEAVDIVERPPSTATLKRVLVQSGLPVTKLFNKSGESYRAGGFKDKLKSMSKTEALAALSKDGKLVKRPLVLGDDFALVGFDEKAYAEKLGSL